MSTSRIFYRRAMGLDIKVWSVMMIAGFLSLGLLGYNKMMVNKPCSPALISVNGTTNPKNAVYYLGDNLLFSSSVAQNDEVVWNFGDETRPSEGTIKSHKFMKAGKFPITALVNGKCENIILITIIKKPVPVTKNNIEFNASDRIIGDTFPTAGIEEKYIYDSIANSYEWIIMNYPDIKIQNGKEAVFKFPVAGSYTIRLTLDGDPKKGGTKEVYVSEPKPAATEQPRILIPVRPRPRLPKPSIYPTIPTPMPVEPKDDGPKFITVSDETFKSKLEGVMKRNITAKEFEKYFCYEPRVEVINKKKNRTKKPTFSSFCENLRGIDNIRIISVAQQYEENGCLQVIKFIYEPKGVLGLGRDPFKND